MAYYQHNSLGSSFPGVDTTLRYPYRDMLADGGPSTRSRSTSATPAPPVAPPEPDTERWADVMFAFHAEYPDELTIDVSSP